MAYTKNYYQILGLSVPGRDTLSPKPKSPDLRRAYRHALLAAHPDKRRTGTAIRTGSYTVDDVKEAYMVLDNITKRIEYDNWILRNPHILSAHAGTGVDENNRGQTLSQDFILGLELLDLSDFEERDDGGGDGDGDGDGDDAEEVEWTRACRCGDEKGFRILEDDLEDAESRGEKEVLVGCQGCSLWVRVGFDVEEV